MLKVNKVDLLVDIRTVPRSRHNPQYEHAALEQALRQAGIDYTYQKDLGGLRPKAERSVSAAWRNQSFRNYADYMQTKQFSEAVDELVERSQKNTVVIMCAEAVPWRCHRSLVGDALLSRGNEVLDIMSKTSTKPHTMTSFAVVDGQKVTYPGDETEQGDSGD